MNHFGYVYCFRHVCHNWSITGITSTSNEASTPNLPLVSQVMPQPNIVQLSSDIFTPLLPAHDVICSHWGPATIHKSTPSSQEPYGSHRTRKLSLKAKEAGILLLDGVADLMFGELDAPKNTVLEPSVCLVQPSSGRSVQPSPASSYSWRNSVIVFC